MGFFIGLLTFVLVLDCLLLILLVIVQLPKKEAGAGIAFGGGTADALFGAGSGNVLTKITKYAIGILFVLAILISILQKSATKSNFAREVENPSPLAPLSSTPVPATAPTAVDTNGLVLSIPATNSPAGQ